MNAIRNFFSSLGRKLTWLFSSGREFSRAASGGSLETLKYYAESGCNLNDCGDYDGPSICEAAGHGQLKVVEFLLSWPGIDINASHRGRTALHEAALSNYPAIAKMLLDKGIDTNKRDNDGKTALCWAASKGYDDIAYQILLRDETDPNLAPENGVAPLHHAIENKKIMVMHAMLGHARTNAGLATAKGRTPLHLAAKHEFPESIELLLQRADVSPDAADERGRMAIHDAALEGNAGSLAILVAHPKIKLSPQDRDGNTPLHLAVMAQKEEACRLLILGNADVATANAQGKKPLDCAAGTFLSRLEDMLASAQNARALKQYQGIQAGRKRFGHHPSGPSL